MLCPFLCVSYYDHGFSYTGHTHYAYSNEFNRNHDTLSGYEIHQAAIRMSKRNSRDDATVLSVRKEYKPEQAPSVRDIGTCSRLHLRRRQYGFRNIERKQ